jgi:hypothetical protein
MVVGIQAREHDTTPVHAHRSGTRSRDEKVGMVITARL